MITEINNIDRIKDKNKGLYNVLCTLDYGTRKVETLVNGQVVIQKISLTAQEHFDEIFDYDELIAFLDEGVVINDVWTVVEDGRLIEQGYKSTLIIRSKYPGMVKIKKDPIYKALQEYKRDYDFRFQEIEHRSSLEGSYIKRTPKKCSLYSKVEIKDIDDKYKEEVSDEERAIILPYIEGSFNKYAEIIVKSALVKKFIGLKKGSIMVFIIPANSGKSETKEISGTIIPIYEDDDVQRIFAERAKVDAVKFNTSLVLWFDEQGFVGNVAKKLANSKITLSLAYSKRLVDVEAPLAVFTSHEDSQDHYNVQFQERVVKVNIGDGEIVNIVDAIAELEKQGINKLKLGQVTHDYLREVYERSFREFMEDKNKVLDEVSAFVTENQLESEKPVDIVKADVEGWFRDYYSQEDKERKRLQRKYNFRELGINVGGSGKPRVWNRCCVFNSFGVIKQGLLSDLLDKGHWYETNKAMMEQIMEFKSGCLLSADGVDSFSEQKRFVMFEPTGHTNVSVYNDNVSENNTYSLEEIEKEMEKTLAGLNKV